MKLLLVTLAALVGSWVLLMGSGARLLVSETKVRPGTAYVTEEYGDLGAASQTSLVCRYFTGRDIHESVFWYSASNTFARDSCPFIYKP